VSLDTRFPTRDKHKAPGARHPPAAEAFATATVLGVDVLGVSSSGPYDAEFTQRIADNGFLFGAWTINDAETARRRTAKAALTSRPPGLGSAAALHRPLPTTTTCCDTDAFSTGAGKS
jgi:hypothetical protein